MKRVSSEIAIALNEMGYDEMCDAHYIKGRELWENNDPDERNSYKSGDWWVSAPYLDEVIEWFDKMGIYIFPSLWPDDSDNTTPSFVVRVESKLELLAMPITVFESRNEAKEAGIKEAIAAYINKNTKP